MIAYRRAVAAVDGLHGRTVTVRLVAWDTPAEVSDNGRDYYLESFARGGLDADPVTGRLLARFEHDGPLVGQIIRSSLDNRPDGLYADVSLRDTAAARDLLALLDDQLDDGAIVDAVSVEFDDDPVPAGTPAVHRTRARLTGVAFTPQPQHHTARVLAVRSQPEGNPAMTTEETITDDTIDEPVEVADGDAAELVDDPGEPAPVRQPAAVTRSVRRPGGNAARPAGFDTFADYIVAAYNGNAPAHVAAEFHLSLIHI